MMWYSCWNVISVFIVIFYTRYASGLNSGPPHNKAVFCYLATYADHRPGRGNFDISNVNPALCTHLVYAYVHLNETDGSVHPIAPWPDLLVDQTDGKNNVSKLKDQYPHLKVMIAVGGWEDGSLKYSLMAANATRRSSFVNKTVDFLKKHNFDGIDLVWSFPSKRGGGRHDKKNLVELLKDLRKAFNIHNFIITAALDSSKDTIDYGYDVKSLNIYLDYMLVLSYDFHGAGWSRLIGHNAPLYGLDLLNAAFSIDYLLKLAANPSKLIMSVPFYGRCFLAETPINTSSTLPGLGLKLQNVTFSGPYTQEDGFLGYNEICLEFKESPNNWTIFWDPSARVPFAVNGKKFITYDNVVSVREKVSFSVRRKLGGIMVWSVDTDDFLGDCKEEVDGYNDFPLLRSANLELAAYVDGSSNNVDEDVEVAPVLETGSVKSDANPLVILASVCVTFGFVIIILLTYALLTRRNCLKKKLKQVALGM